MAVVVAPNGRGADVDQPRLPPPVPRDDWKSVRFLVSTFYHIVVNGNFHGKGFASSIYFLLWPHGFQH